MRFGLQRTSPASGLAFKWDIFVQANKGDSRKYFFSLNNLFAIIIAAVCLMGCSDAEAWSDEKDRFVQTYNVILYQRENGGDTLQIRRRIDSALAAGGFNEQSFQAQFDEFSRNPNVLRRILDSAQIRAQRAAQKK